MTFAILKILFVLIWEPTIPITYHERYTRFGNYCSCFAHQAKELKGLIGIAILLKGDNSTLMNPITISSVEAKDPNTPISTTVDVIVLIVVEFGVEA